MSEVLLRDIDVVAVFNWDPDTHTSWLEVIPKFALWVRPTEKVQKEFQAQVAETVAKLRASGDGTPTGHVYVICNSPRKEWIVLQDTADLTVVHVDSSNAMEFSLPRFVRKSLPS